MRRLEESLDLLFQLRASDLLAKVQTSKSALDTMKDSDLEATAECVANLANDNIAALAA